MSVQIQHGLPDSLRWRAVEIYYEAFAQKFAPLFTLEQTLAVFPQMLQPEQGLFAFFDGQLAGFAGLQHRHRPLFQPNLRLFLKTFDLFPGLVCYLALLLFHCASRPGELLMDGICEEVTIRGQGVGTRLLGIVCEFAKEQGYHSIRLDVVDTNPRARRLYERLEFVATRTGHYPLTLRLMGFSVSTTMQKSLTS